MADEATNMRYHDFHLEGYVVRNFGDTIELNLVWNYADEPKDRSNIEFSEVAAYHFIHTGSAILLDISEETIGNLLQIYGSQLSESWRLHGAYPLWNDDPAVYCANLERDGYHAWFIYSAIGFGGFVIAKSVAQKAS